MDVGARWGVAKTNSPPPAASKPPPPSVASGGSANGNTYNLQPLKGIVMRNTRLSHARAPWHGQTW